MNSKRVQFDVEEGKEETEEDDSCAMSLKEKEQETKTPLLSQQDSVECLDEQLEPPYTMPDGAKRQQNSYQSHHPHFGNHLQQQKPAQNGPIAVQPSISTIADFQMPQQQQQIGALDLNGKATTAQKFIRMADKAKEEHAGEVCFFGKVQLRHAVFGIAFVELLIFGYQLIVSSVDLIPNSDQPPMESHPISGLLTLLSLFLAITAVVLLLIGVLRQSAYLLMPHLLMQFALFVATLLVIGYLVLWLLGGILLQINTVFYDKSNQEGQEKSHHNSPIQATIIVPQLKWALLLILFVFVLLMAFQIWLTWIVFAMFRHLRSQNTTKSFEDVCLSVSTGSPTSQSSSKQHQNGILPTPSSSHSPTERTNTTSINSKEETGI